MKSHVWRHSPPDFFFFLIGNIILFMKDLMNFTNARTKEQLLKMKQLQKNKVCLFCRKNIEKHGDSKILKEGKFWLVRHNDFPYQGTKAHLLLVYKKHIETFEKVSKKSLPELIDLIKWAKKKFNMKGASFLLRFGASKYTGATISHLHAHLISGVKNSKKVAPIFTVVGFKK